MNDRQLVPANRTWAKVVGYSRAVRIGSVVEVAGTAAAGPGGSILHPGDVEAQAREALRIIGEALKESGASFADVVRTRIYLADASTWEAAGKAHGEVFADIRPATTAIAVNGFVDPEILVEIEATAIVAD